MTEKAYAMIMAGGAGKRLWPLSRKSRPKPLLPLVDKERSMFQIAVDRLLPLLPPDHIFVVANHELSQQLKAQAPNIPGENFIVEPEGRDTAPAVGLGAVHIHHRDPEAVMAVLTADHFIADEDTFRKVLGTACEVAQANDAIVTLGIKPDFPSTGFGYIERGALAQTVREVEVYALNQFKEKPDEARAREFFADERYSWNSGMFIWQTRRVLDEFKKHASDIHAGLQEILTFIGQPDYEEILAKIWPEMRRISIDFALMEHVNEGVFVIPAEMGWTDIGNFDTLYDIIAMQNEADQNALTVHQEPVMLDSQRNLVFSKRVVSTIGLEDMVIIDTDDVLLVCHRDRVQDVKKLVEQLEKGQRSEYL